MTRAPNTSAVRQGARWCALFVFVCIALLYLKSAVYSAWMSGGPPNPYPIGWSRRALGHLCFSAAALFIGIGLFRFILTFPKVGRGALALLAIGLILTAAPYIGRFVLADRCLDQGGSWSNQTIQCSNE